MKKEKIDYKKERRLKKRLEKEADRLWHLAGIKKWGNICFFHDSGKEAKAHQKFIKFGHHIKPKGLYPNLRYDLDNFLNCCWPCHFRLEKCDRSMVGDVYLKRGKKWANRLEKRNKEIKFSFETIKWYNDNIKRLKNYAKRNLST